MGSYNFLGLPVLNLNHIAANSDNDPGLVHFDFLWLIPSLSLRQFAQKRCSITVPTFKESLLHPRYSVPS